MAKQNVTTQLFYDGGWHDADAYTRDEISISRGRGDEQSEPTPSTARVTLDNRDGSKNPRNPTSSLFRKIGRNTPARVCLDPVIEDFEDTTLNVTIVDLGNAAWARTNTAAHTGTWSLKSGSISNSQDTQAWISVPAGATTLEFWYKVSSEANADFFDVYLVDPPNFTLLFSASGTVDWTKATIDVTGATQVAFFYSKNSSGSAGSDAAFIDDLEFRNTRIVSEASSWAPERTPDFDPGTGRGDAWTRLETAGILRRLLKGGKLDSAITRTAKGNLANGTLYGYWPIEDESSADYGASALPGGGVLVFDPANAPSFANDKSFPGSAPIAKMNGSGFEAGLVSITDTGTISLRCLLVIPGGGLTDSTNLLDIFVNGSNVDRWTVQYKSGGSLALYAVNSSGGSIHNTGSIGFDINGKAFQFDLDLVQNGSNVDTHMLVWKVTNGVVAPTGNFWNETFNSVTTGKPYRFVAGAFGSLNGASLGQVVIGNNVNIAYSSGDKKVLVGWSGETAGTRFLRLCAEQGVAASIKGDPNVTVPMGPQVPETLIELLAEIERTDRGILYEQRAARALVYRTAGHMYNQAATLALDWDAGGIAPPLVPIVDDLPTRNDVTVNRRDGSSARAVQETGPLNVKDPADDPDGVGRTTTTVDVNTETDVYLDGLAAWYLKVGTVDEFRYPRVVVDLDAAPELAAAASTMDVGDRITISNVPIDVDPNPVSLMALGYVERIGSHRRIFAYNCVPYAPYEVFETDGDHSRLADNGDSTIANGGGINATTTSISVATPSTLWSTASGDYPSTIEVDGERMTLTAVSGSSSPQTFTVIRSINGVVRSHAQNAVVTVVDAFAPTP